MLAFVVAIVLVFITFSAKAVLAGLVIAVAYGAWYGWSIIRRPYRPCWWCHGAGAKTGFDPGNDREGKRTPLGRCWICHGRKKQVRWGVIWFRRKTYREIRAGKAGLSH
jgi:hypothetical protein